MDPITSIVLLGLTIHGLNGLGSGGMVTGHRAASIAAANASAQILARHWGGKPRQHREVKTARTLLTALATKTGTTPKELIRLHQSDLGALRRLLETI